MTFNGALDRRLRSNIKKISEIDISQIHFDQYVSTMFEITGDIITVLNGLL